MGSVCVILATFKRCLRAAGLTDLARPGLGAALSGRLAPYVLSAPDVQNNEVQARTIRTLKVPDYFAEYRDKGDGLAGFLGTSIIAKVSKTVNVIILAFMRPPLTILRFSSRSMTRQGRIMF